MNTIAPKYPFTSQPSPLLTGTDALASNAAITGTTIQTQCFCIALARRHIEQLLPCVVATQHWLVESQTALQGIHTIAWEGVAASQARQEARQLTLSCQHCTRSVHELRLRLESWM
ncbi:hypothetical protein [Bifidobacterium aquikefiri]|uniref:hypothetical protein n=1 Tax=Bifidobacterium aquikefiri TaxID=1653207 RepID=UPI0039EB9566